MADEPTSPAPEPVQTPAKAAVSGNPALVEWPRDEWGNLSELRGALLKAAGTVRGDDEKHKLLLATLGIGAQHAIARLAKDKASVLQDYADEEARIARSANGRSYGQAVD